MSLGPIKPNEIVARVLVQRNQVKWAIKAVHAKAFLLSDGMTDISVHRRSHMSADEALRYAMETARIRGKTKIYGWAETSAARAEGEGRKVLATPTDNRYHATIQLPPGAATDRQIRMFHALILAERSRWVEPPAEFPPHAEA